MSLLHVRYIHHVSGDLVETKFNLVLRLNIIVKYNGQKILRLNLLVLSVCSGPRLK